MKGSASGSPRILIHDTQMNEHTRHSHDDVLHCIASPHSNGAGIIGSLGVVPLLLSAP